MTNAQAVGSEAFGPRLERALDQHGPLCVGIDPHAQLLNQWELPDSAVGLREFGLRVVEAAAGVVGVVKPQVAFFERFGSAGFAVLEEIMVQARQAGLIVIADAKRGDIGSTMAGYAQAWLGLGSALEADALTVSPYLGVTSLGQTAELALQNGKGLFVLAATSNPEATASQAASVSGLGDGIGHSVAAEVARQCQQMGSAPESLGSVGVVVGATVDRNAVGLVESDLRGLPILAPGFGAQGVAAAQLREVFGELSTQVIASESRSVLSAGPQRLGAVIAARAAEYVEVLRG